VSKRTPLSSGAPVCCRYLVENVGGNYKDHDQGLKSERSLDGLACGRSSTFSTPENHHQSQTFIHSPPHPQQAISTSIMIQRNLLRASKSLGTTLPNRTLTAPLRHSSPFIRSPAIQSPFSRVASRWYSDAAEAKPAKGEGDKPAAEGPSEVETLKKSLEAKNKEVVDLKVRSLLVATSLNLSKSFPKCDDD
jgi:hypothetical protein